MPPSFHAGRAAIFVLMEPRVLLLTGESGCGKSTVCLRIVELACQNGLTAAGVISPPSAGAAPNQRRDVLDVGTGRRRTLAAKSGFSRGPTLGRWRFRAGALAWGAAVIRRGVPCDLFIVDELGPLELVRGQGWTAALDVARGGGYRLAVLVVRPALAALAQDRLAGVQVGIQPVTAENRDGLAARILASLGGRT